MQAGINIKIVVCLDAKTIASQLKPLPTGDFGFQIAYLRVLTCGVFGCWNTKTTWNENVHTGPVICDSVLSVVWLVYQLLSAHPPAPANHRVASEHREHNNSLSETLCEEEVSLFFLCGKAVSISASRKADASYQRSLSRGSTVSGTPSLVNTRLNAINWYSDSSKNIFYFFYLYLSRQEKCIVEQHFRLLGYKNLVGFGCSPPGKAANIPLQHGQLDMWAETGTGW